MKCVRTISFWAAVTSLCVSFGIVLSIWRLLPQGLITGTDGRFLIAVTTQARDFGVIWYTTHINSLQGAFNIGMPFNPVLTSIMPLAFLELEAGRLWASALSLAIYAVGIVTLARAVGLSYWLVPIAVAVPVAVQIFPFQYEFGFTGQFLIMPACYGSVGQFSLILALILSANNDLHSMTKTYGAVFVVALWAIASEPLWAGLHGAFFAPFVLAALVAKGSHFVRHGLVLVAMAVLLWLIGPLEYLYVVLAGNARTMLNVEFVRPEVGVLTLSSAIFASKFALYAYVIAALGLLAGIVLADRRMQVVSGCCFLLLTGFFALMVYFLAIADRWALPMPIYLETAIFHIFWIVALAAIGSHFAIAFAGAERFFMSRPLRVGAFASGIVLVAIVPASALWYRIEVAPLRENIYRDNVEFGESVARSIVRMRNERSKTGKSPGAVAFLETGRREHEAARAPIYGTTIVSLWQQGVPTMNEYSQLVIPPAHLLATRLAHHRDIPIFLNGLNFTKYQENLYRLFGVEFVVSSVSLQGRNLVSEPPITFGMNDVYSFYSYRVRDFVSPLTPGRTRRIASLAEAIGILNDPAFDVREEVLVEADIADPVVRADRANFRHYRGDLLLDVESNGRSIAVLPVVFSRCWRAVDPSVKLFRADGGMLGVLTTGNSKVVLKFRLSLWTPGCRRDDIRDWKRDIAAIGSDGLMPASWTATHPRPWIDRLLDKIKLAHW